MLNLDSKDLDLVLGWEIYHDKKQPKKILDFYHGTSVGASTHPSHVYLSRALINSHKTGRVFPVHVEGELPSVKFLPPLV
jgi:hypothetical protein